MEPELEIRQTHLLRPLLGPAHEILKIKKNKNKKKTLPPNFLPTFRFSLWEKKGLDRLISRLKLQEHEPIRALQMLLKKKPRKKKKEKKKKKTRKGQPDVVGGKHKGMKEGDEWGGGGGGGGCFLFVWIFKGGG